MGDCFEITNHDKPWRYDLLSQNPNIIWENGVNLGKNNPNIPWNDFLSLNPNIMWNIIENNPEIPWIIIKYLKIQILCGI